VVIGLPRHNTTGYRNVTILSPDGGYAHFQDALFFTDDCPYEGLEISSSFDMVRL
jgi:hypothetical protein